jgi:hypothetical protein
MTGMRTDMDTDMDDYRIGKVDRHFAKVNNGFYLRTHRYRHYEFLLNYFMKARAVIRHVQFSTICIHKHTGKLRCIASNLFFYKYWRLKFIESVRWRFKAGQKH